MESVVESNFERAWNEGQKLRSTLTVVNTAVD